MHKVISFDIGGTLISESNNTKNKKYDLKSLSLLLNLPYEIVRITYKDVYQKMNGGFDELLNIFCSKLGIDIKEEYIKFFKKKFLLSSKSNTISSDIINLIRKIKEKGYKVILVSNSCSLINNNLSKEVLTLIDGLYYSYNIGYTKSDKELYEYIEKDIGYSKGEILHIGDTLSSDYRYPIKYGWDALYYGIPNEKDVEYIINLNELESLL